MMARKWCPECGGFSFGFDPLLGLHRCYTVGCGFVDVERKYNEGLDERPDNPRREKYTIFKKTEAVTSV